MYFWQVHGALMNRKTNTGCSNKFCLKTLYHNSFSIDVVDRLTSAMWTWILKCIWTLFFRSSKCSMLSVMKAIEPARGGEEKALCPTLFHSPNPTPFQRAFANDEYVLLQLWPMWNKLESFCDIYSTAIHYQLAYHMVNYFSEHAPPNEKNRTLPQHFVMW